MSALARACLEPEAHWLRSGLAAFASFGTRSIEAVEDNLPGHAENFFRHSFQRCYNSSLSE
jgi:hypothetical protein